MDAIRKPRSKYDALFTLLMANPGSWVAINSKEIAGVSLGAKQTTILQAARRASIHSSTDPRVETKTGADGNIYVRLFARPQLSEASAVFTLPSGSDRGLYHLLADLFTVQGSAEDENA